MPDRESHSTVKVGSEKSFGVVFATVFFIVGCYPLLGGGTPRWWALIVAAAFLSVSLLYPRILTVPNKLWFRIGIAMGAIIAPVVMALLFFAVFTPMGLIMRLLGKDPLRTKLDQNCDTYWITRQDKMPDLKNQY